MAVDVDANARRVEQHLQSIVARADEGRAGAQKLLSLLYRKGIVFERDDGLAEYWARRASASRYREEARRGKLLADWCLAQAEREENPEVLADLGRLYDEGCGDPGDAQVAPFWQEQVREVGDRRIDWNDRALEMKKAAVHYAELAVEKDAAAAELLAQLRPVTRRR